MPTVVRLSQAYTLQEAISGIAQIAKKGGYSMDRFTETMLVKKVKNSGRAKIRLDDLPNFFGSEEEFIRIVRKYGFSYYITDNFVLVKRGK